MRVADVFAGRHALRTEAGARSLTESGAGSHSRPLNLLGEAHLRVAGQHAVVGDDRLACAVDRDFLEITDLAIRGAVDALRADRARLHRLDVDARGEVVGRILVADRPRRARADVVG